VSLPARGTRRGASRWAGPREAGAARPTRQTAIVRWKRHGPRGSFSLDTIPVVGRQQQDLVVPPAQDDIEMVEDVAAKDAQIGGGGVGKGGELAADSGQCSVLAREFQNDVDQHEFAGSTNPLEDQVGWRPGGRNSEMVQEFSAQDGKPLPIPFFLGLLFWMKKHQPLSFWGYFG